jgi:hypothetical protein
MAKFKRTASALGQSGTALMGYPDLDDKTIRALFGKPVEDAYYEPERGYEGEGYWFEDVVTGEPIELYSRWGVFRIGARSPEAAARFNQWLNILAAGK